MGARVAAWHAFMHGLSCGWRTRGLVRLSRPAIIPTDNVISVNLRCEAEAAGKRSRRATYFGEFGAKCVCVDQLQVLHARIATITTITTLSRAVVGLRKHMHTLAPLEHAFINTRSHCRQSRRFVHWKTHRVVSSLVLPNTCPSNDGFVHEIQGGRTMYHHHHQRTVSKSQVHTFDRLCFAALDRSCRSRLRARSAPTAPIAEPFELRVGRSYGRHRCEARALGVWVQCGCGCGWHGQLSATRSLFEFVVGRRWIAAVARRSVQVAVQGVAAWHRQQPEPLSFSHGSNAATIRLGRGALCGVGAGHA
jgi:hypothetical protein